MVIRKVEMTSLLIPGNAGVGGWERFLLGHVGFDETVYAGFSDSNLARKRWGVVGLVFVIILPHCFKSGVLCYQQTHSIEFMSVWTILNCFWLEM